MYKRRFCTGTVIILIIIVPFIFTYASENNYLNTANAPYSVTLKLVNEVSLPGNPSDIYIKDDYAYILCPSVVLVRISEPYNIPKIKIYSDLATDPTSIAFNGSFAYLAQSDGVIKIVNFQNIDKPVNNGSVNSFGNITKVSVLNGYLYFITKELGLHVYDVTVPNVPMPKGNQVVSGEPSGLFLKNNYAYISSSNATLTIINVSDISKLPIAGTYNFGINFYDVYVNENYAYVPQGATGVQVLDVGTLPSPKHITNIFSRNFSKQVVVDGYYAWVNDDNSIQAFYSREPEDQLFAGSYDNGDYGINKIAVVDNKYIYLCSSNNKLKVIQIYYNY
jgi:hypothetical protein